MLFSVSVRRKRKSLIEPRTSLSYVIVSERQSDDQAVVHDMAPSKPMPSPFLFTGLLKCSSAKPAPHFPGCLNVKSRTGRYVFGPLTVVLLACRIRGQSGIGPSFRRDGFHVGRSPGRTGPALQGAAGKHVRLPYALQLQRQLENAAGKASCARFLRFNTNGPSGMYCCLRKPRKPPDRPERDRR